MGCGSPREKLENLMIAYKLERMDVQMEKEKELRKLAEIEGHDIKRYQVPDYIDPKFAKEKRLYIEPEESKEKQFNDKIETKRRKKYIKKILKVEKKAIKKKN